MNTMTKAAADVLAERKRQVEAEGWTPEHDDEHKTGAMASAAGCYALHAAAGAATSQYWRDRLEDVLHDLWPWDRKWFKPTTNRQNLVKAGALILAEIERLDRATDKPLLARPKPPAGTIRRECDAPPSPETRP